MKKIRLVVVVGQRIVREGLVTMLANYPDMEVVGQADDGTQALGVIEQSRPDVVMLDLIKPNQDRLVPIPKIIETSPDTHILVVTGLAGNEMIFQAIQAGAIGSILLYASRDQLVKAIREAAKGQASLAPSIAARLIQEINQPSKLHYTKDPLTRRELETIYLIARGLSNEEVAAELAVKERTIVKYVNSILDKLHLANLNKALLSGPISPNLAGDSATDVPPPDVK